MLLSACFARLPLLDLQSSPLGRLLQLLAQHFSRWQVGQVLGHVDARLVLLQQFDLLALLAGAQDDPQGRSFFRLPLVLVQPTQVKLHLSCVRCLELADLQFDGHQPPQFAVVEKQIEVEILVIDLDTLLAGNEAKTRTQFQQEFVRSSPVGAVP